MNSTTKKLYILKENNLGKISVKNYYILAFFKVLNLPVCF